MPGSVVTRTNCLRKLLAVVVWAGGMVAARGDDLSAKVAEPAVVVTLASVDRVLSDVDYLLRAGDAPGYADFVRGFVAGLNDLQGIDRQRLLGVMLFLDPSRPEAEPAPLIGLPMTDVQALQTTIASTGNELAATNDPRLYRLRLGQDELNLTLSGDYGLITNPKHPVPADAARSAVAWLESADVQADVAVHIRRAGLAAAAIDKLLQNLRRDADQELQAKEGESDEEYRLRTDLQRGVFDVLELVLTESQELRGELTLEPDAPLQAHLEYHALPDAALSDWIGELLSEPRRLALAENVPFALRWQSALSLTGAGRELARRFTGLARRNVLRELGPNAPVDLIEQLNRAFDALDATASAGQAETRLDFLPTPTGRFVLLAGVAVSLSESIDGALRAALPLAANASDLPAVTLDALRLRGLNFHEIPGMPVRDRDRKLYGANPVLLVAAGREAVWGAVGGPETPQVLAAAFQPEVTEPLPTTAAQLTVRLLPWAELAALEGGQRERAIADIARQTLQSDSAVTASLEPTDDGLRLAFTAGDDYVRLVAKLAVLRARKR